MKKIIPLFLISFMLFGCFSKTIDNVIKEKGYFEAYNYYEERNELDNSDAVLLNWANNLLLNKNRTVDDLQILSLSFHNEKNREILKNNFDKFLIENPEYTDENTFQLKTPFISIFEHLIESELYSIDDLNINKDLTNYEGLSRLFYCSYIKLWEKHQSSNFNEFKTCIDLCNYGKYKRYDLMWDNFVHFICHNYTTTLSDLISVENVIDSIPVFCLTYKDDIRLFKHSVKVQKEANEVLIYMDRKSVHFDPYYYKFLDKALLKVDKTHNIVHVGYLFKNELLDRFNFENKVYFFDGNILIEFDWDSLQANQLLVDKELGYPVIYSVDNEKLIYYDIKVSYNIPGPTVYDNYYYAFPYAYEYSFIDKTVTKISPIETIEPFSTIPHDIVMKYRKEYHASPF